MTALLTCCCLPLMLVAHHPALTIGGIARSQSQVGLITMKHGGLNLGLSSLVLRLTGGYSKTSWHEVTLASLITMVRGSMQWQRCQAFSHTPPRYRRRRLPGRFGVRKWQHSHQSRFPPLHLPRPLVRQLANHPGSIRHSRAPHRRSPPPEQPRPQNTHNLYSYLTHRRTPQH